jgi:uncharacterized protein (DUF885 family)
MKSRITFVTVLALTMSVVTGAQGRQVAADKAVDHAAAFRKLVDAEWEYTLQQNPERASRLGDRRWNDRWRDVSPEASEARQAHEAEVLGAITAIDRSQLPESERLNYDLFRKQYEDTVAGHKYRWYLVAVTQRGGVQTANELADALQFRSVKDYEDWLARVRSVPRLVEQTTALLRQGIAERRLLPKVILERVPGQIDAQIVDDPATSPFFKPFTRFPDSIPAADRERLAAAARDTVRDGVVPAYRRFKDFFVKEYLPASFDQVGVWQMPDGDEFYAYRARLFTTTSMTPKEIHEIGLKEVARIRGEMDAVMKRVGFGGTLKEFFHFLRTDPRFYYRTGEELLEGYRATSKRIDPHLTKVFKTLPRTPYGVIPIPDAIAPDTTTAYYNGPAADGSRPGYYYVNLYKPAARPKWEMMALSLHEAVPGHHLQIARAMELGEIPNFRRYGGYTAFVEGWGLYAESLGEDMGLYDDPYAKFGQLTYEMWRAVRLVVDTGMHAFEWDRQRAIDYFMENAAKSELDVVNEIDRYISMPGQALAYKVGELKLKALRARASAALGERFDLREFHDVVLGSGAVPLDVLERSVAEWIAERRGAATK